MGRRGYTVVDHERVQALADSLSLREISRVTGIHINTLRNWQGRGLIHLPAMWQMVRPLCEETIVKIERTMAVMRHCSSWLELARLTGHPESTIYDWACRFGWVLGDNKAWSPVLTGCERCKNPLRDQCSQHWCACCDDVVDLPEPDELSDAEMEPPLSNWWERVTEPSPLVLAARVLAEV